MSNVYLLICVLRNKRTLGTFSTYKDNSFCNKYFLGTLQGLKKQGDQGGQFKRKGEKVTSSKVYAILHICRSLFQSNAIKYIIKSSFMSHGYSVSARL